MQFSLHSLCSAVQFCMPFEGKVLLLGATKVKTSPIFLVSHNSNLIMILLFLCKKKTILHPKHWLGGLQRSKQVQLTTLAFPFCWGLWERFPVFSTIFSFGIQGTICYTRQPKSWLRQRFCIGKKALSSGKNFPKRLQIQRPPTRSIFMKLSLFYFRNNFFLCQLDFNSPKQQIKMPLISSCYAFPPIQREAFFFVPAMEKVESKYKK